MINTWKIKCLYGSNFEKIKHPLLSGSTFVMQNAHCALMFKKNSAKTNMCTQSMSCCKLPAQRLNEINMFDVISTLSTWAELCSTKLQKKCWNYPLRLMWLLKITQYFQILVHCAMVKNQDVIFSLEKILHSNN